MTARSRELVQAAAAVGLFLTAWGLLHVGFYERDQITDTPVYENYGGAIVDGRVPYRDFEVEYPPGALPVFLVPALGGEDGYGTRFKALMAACGAATVVAVALARRRLRFGFPTLAFVALAPLALGSVVLTRFDLWPAMLGAFAVSALVADRLRLGHALLGAAVAAKLYALVLLPLALAYVWRRRGRRDALVCAGIAAAVVAAVYLPFFVVAPEGVAASVGRQLSRPLQIESLGSALLLAAHEVAGLQIEMESSHGSQNLVGPLPELLAGLLSFAQIAVLCWLWARFLRIEPTAHDLVAFAAAALTAFVALGKVLSPQFLIWLIPLVPLARRARATALLAGALVLTQLWFPFRYWELVLEFDPSAIWFVLARDLVLVVLLAVLAGAAVSAGRPQEGRRATRPERAEARTA